MSNETIQKAGTANRTIFCLHIPFGEKFVFNQIFTGFDLYMTIFGHKAIRPVIMCVFVCVCANMGCCSVVALALMRSSKTSKMIIGLIRVLAFSLFSVYTKFEYSSGFQNNKSWTEGGEGAKEEW